MKTAIIFLLLIIAPILHQCNSTTPPNDRRQSRDADLLQVAIKKDWENKQERGYEFLRRLKLAKDRFKVTLFHAILANVEIPASISESNARADVFYFRNEKNYKAEDLHVKIEVAESKEIIIRKTIGCEISILPEVADSAAESAQQAGGGEEEDHGDEGRMPTLEELEEEIKALATAKACLTDDCKGKAIRLLESQWRHFYVVNREIETKTAALELRKQKARTLRAEGDAVPNEWKGTVLEAEEKGLAEERKRATLSHRILLQRQTAILFGEKPEMPLQMRPQQHSASSSARQPTMPFDPSNSTRIFGTNFSDSPTSGGTSVAQQNVNWPPPMSRDTFSRPTSSGHPAKPAIFAPIPSTDPSPSSGPPPSAFAARLFDAMQSNRAGTSNAMHQNAMDKNAMDQNAMDQNAPPPSSGHSGRSRLRFSTRNSALHSLAEIASNSDDPIAAVPLQTIRPDETTIPQRKKAKGKGPASPEIQKELDLAELNKIKREWVRRYYFEIDTNPTPEECQEIATVLHKRKEQILDQFRNLRKKYKKMTEAEREQTRKHRDQFMKKMREGFTRQEEELKKRKRESPEIEQKRPKVEFSELERERLEWYRDNVDRTPFLEKCQEIANVFVNKTAKKIKNNRKGAVEKIRTNEERDQLHAEFMNDLWKRFPNGLMAGEEEEMPQIAPLGSTKEMIGHMGKGKGKRPASSAAAEEEQPKRKARTKYSEEETAWLFLYLDHVFMYTSLKMKTRSKETDEIAKVIRGIEPSRTGEELLNHKPKSDKNVIVIEEKLRQKLHVAFVKKLRAEFPGKPEEGAPLPSIDDLRNGPPPHIIESMDEGEN